MKSARFLFTLAILAAPLLADGDDAPAMAPSNAPAPVELYGVRVTGYSEGTLGGVKGIAVTCWDDKGGRQMVNSVFLGSKNKLFVKSTEGSGLVRHIKVKDFTELDKLLQESKLTVGLKNVWFNHITGSYSVDDKGNKAFVATVFYDPEATDRDI